MTASRLRWMPALFVLIAIVYGHGVDQGFHFDDDNTIVHNPVIRPPVQWHSVWTDPEAFSRAPGAGMFRPLLLSTFVLNYMWSGLEGWSWHVVNIALHACVTVLVVLLGHQAGCRPMAALTAGIFFALHPLCVEPVSYISSRSELLATGFLLACLLGHMRSRQPAAAWPHLALSIGALAAGLLCKATAATAPLLIGAYEILVLRSRPREVMQRVAPSAFLVLAYVLFVRGLLSEALLVAPVRDLTSQLATQAKALGYYTRLVVMPHPLSVEHPFTDASWFEVEAWLGLVLVLSVALLGYRATDGRLRFSLLWPLLVLLPTIIIPLNVMVSEHRLYPALAGLMPFAARLLSGPRRLRPALIGCAVLLMALTVQRTAVWASERSLWEEAARWTAAPRPHVRLALVERAEGRLDAAEFHLRAALDADAMHAPAWNNLGNVQRQRGDLAAAEASYAQALSLLPSYPEALTNLAVLRVQQGRFDESRALYERALEIQPDHDLMHNNLGTLLLRLGEFEAAEQHLRRALVLGGDSAAVWRNLSGALAGQGQPNEALTALRRALALDPTYAPAWLDLGNLLDAAGEKRQAHAAWRNFLQHWRGANDVAEGVRQLLRPEVSQ